MEHQPTPIRYGRLWAILIAIVLGSFAVLGYYGREIYQSAPPIPKLVQTADGQAILSGDDIRDGQNVWQSTGGQELGTIWGHGAYVAPDWSADFLHREALFILNKWSQEEKGSSFDRLSAEDQASLKIRLQKELRTNTYDPTTQNLTISPLQAEAIQKVRAHYEGLFGADPTLDKLREDYAIPRNSVSDPTRRKLFSAFIYWTAWATVTQRPDSDISYTSNWPAEPLVGNVPSSQTLVWSVVSIFLLLAGIGVLAWYFAVLRHREQLQPAVALPAGDPLLALHPTPSMRATLKYFWVTAALWVAQVLLGAIVAHYSVEGTSFYGFPLAQFLPYSVARSWHTQLGIFWIATAWLATGLFIAPAVSGHEPKGQRFGVNLLFVALLIIVVGALAGQWLGVEQRLSLPTNFWFGHQGLEYVDLGRFWQWFLFAGLLIWLILVGRALWPALKRPGEGKHLLGLFLIASAAIWLFYGAGLLYGMHTNLAITEYWRWWVVHLWVEGFFEVFATVVIAFLFTRMGLLRTSTATASVLFSTSVFLSGGIIGTFHHLYFTGTPTAVIALGACFSALEVVPLVLVGFEAYENLSLAHAKEWVHAYRWPIYFFVSVSFWNFVGAGLFGFLINPPIALYYMQGLNTTAVHAHTALFGVYGMLGLGLMLFCMKGLTGNRVWKTKLLAFSFWAINIGLLLMILLSMLPVGLMQAWASVQHGYWYARSAEFMHTGTMDTLHWLRIVGDTIFSIGAIALGWFILGLKTGASLEKETEAIAQIAEKE
jgi:nitric oxide reductase subunit B